ncbi:GAF sensor signal transduction histidine kinase [Xylanimonas cellulosilytica DSM 15894]|uniref:GAF sensor signal transduction histidine kinase n=2 Tax=Xylanimonas TaxID=186188 RepID=D1BV97_XYLCX|nr:GAF sensor signal transduction histidine kinase [Xylanimonas cellulosilytica DSM 15894]
MTAGADGERGAGTVLMLGVVAVVLLFGLALAAVGAAQQARGTAQAAADLGALAAATARRAGFDACATAREAVERNRGHLVACELEAGGVVGLTVARSTAGLPGWLARDATARARAGPRPPGG